MADEFTDSGNGEESLIQRMDKIQPLSSNDFEDITVPAGAPAASQNGDFDFKVVTVNLDDPFKNDPKPPEERPVPAKRKKPFGTKKGLQKRKRGRVYMEETDSGSSGSGMVIGLVLACIAVIVAIAIAINLAKKSKTSRSGGKAPVVRTLYGK